MRLCDALCLQGDDYNHIMVESLADRLAEAFAEKLHQIVRKEMWGYAPDEDFSTEDLLKVKYQGGLHLGGRTFCLQQPHNSGRL